MISIRGHSFFPQGIGRDSVVVDLGGNRGEFSTEISQRFGCRCIVVEPSPELAPQIRESERLKVIQCAISNVNGETDFFLSDNCEASTLYTAGAATAVAGVKVPTRTLASILREQGLKHVDLLKVDIEGAERELFESLSEEELQAIDQVTIEFHDFAGLLKPAEVAAIIARLKQSGFSAVKLTRSNKNWAFVRAARRGIGSGTLLHARTIFRAYEVFCTQLDRFRSPVPS